MEEDKIRVCLCCLALSVRGVSAIYTTMALLDVSLLFYAGTLYQQGSIRHYLGLIDSNASYLAIAYYALGRMFLVYICDSLCLLADHAIDLHILFPEPEHGETVPPDGPAFARGKCPQAELHNPVLPFEPAFCIAITDIHSRIIKSIFSPF